MKKFLIKKTRFLLTVVILLVLLTSSVLADTKEDFLANAHEHLLSRMTSTAFSDNGNGKHIASYIEYEYCHYCDYKVIIDKGSAILPHNLSTGNYHSGTLHYIINRCNDCPFDKSYTYKCPGNPCIMPTLVNYSNEETDSLIKFEDELDFINTFFIEEHNTFSNEKNDTLNEEINSLIKFEDELDFINTFFIEENNTYLNEKNNSLESKAASCTKHDLMRITATNYDNNGPSGHTVTYTQYDKCANCDYKKDITPPSQFFEAHNISTSNYHSGTLHYVNEDCSKCPYNRTYSYKCPGNPCIMPTSVKSEY